MPIQQKKRQRNEKWRPAVAGLSPKRNQNGVNLYLHFPYCLYKCHYCDFNSYALKAEAIPFSDYVAAIKRELSLRFTCYEKTGEHFFKPGSVLRTLFFGGGTPSLMSASCIEEIIKEIEAYFIINQDTEISMEANPKTINLEKLRDFKKCGINRLSLGVQSLHDAYLSAFGRIHSADDAREALYWIQEAAFPGWNADLIFGFPGQNMKEWKKDLSEIVSYHPPHLSCYAFTVEEGTIYSKKVRENKKLIPSDEIQADMFEATRRILGKKGYLAYEISNFCKPEKACLHNLNTWNYGSFLGLGAGAVSFFYDCRLGYRTTNVKEPNHYIRNFSFDIEKINRPTAMGEFMMMGLRLKDGINAERFEILFGESVLEAYPAILAKWRQKNWLSQTSVALTDVGRLYANEVMRSFF